MQRGAWIVAVGALLAASGIGIVACSSTHPPPADLGTPPPAADAGSGNKRVSGGSANGGRLCTEDDTGFHEPGACTCIYQWGPQIAITLPCGITVCSEGKHEAAVCESNGHLTVLPGYGIANCPEAGADLAALPPCDAGTPTPPPSDASDAAADAPADTDAG